MSSLHIYWESSPPVVWHLVLVLDLLTERICTCYVRICIFCTPWWSISHKEGATWENAAPVDRLRGLHGNEAHGLDDMANYVASRVIDNKQEIIDQAIRDKVLSMIIDGKHFVAQEHMALSTSDKFLSKWRNSSLYALQTYIYLRISRCWILFGRVNQTFVN